MPALLLAPVLGFLLLLTGVRSRRSAANLTALAVLVLLGLTLLVAWARFSASQPYRFSFPWVSISPAFSGATQFQSFEIDVGYRIDHVALAALAVLSLVFLACLQWHRGWGRNDPGPVRFQVLALLLLVCCVGVAIAGDLAELFAFWTLGGVASWLLLAHRWGVEPAASASRLALGLPFLGDLSLLLGVALLYSRYGVVNLDKLIPVLTTTPGVGQKTLTAACLLIFAGVAARAGLAPFTGWQTATLDAPPAVVALVQAVWPLLAGVLLYRVLPIYAVAGVQAPHASAYWAGVAALACGGLALAGNELRRALVWAGAAAAALGLLAVVSSGGPPGVAALLAVAPARAAVALAGASLVTAMRTGDLFEMGDAWRRMRQSALALGLGGLGLAFAGAVGAAWRSDGLSWRSALVGLAVALVGAAAARAWFAVSTGPLRRRRAFEPDRVRDPLPVFTAPAVFLGALAAVAVGLGFFTGSLRFLAMAAHPSPPVGTFVLWSAVALAGVIVAGAAVAARRRLVLAWTALLGRRWAGYLGGTAAVVRAYLEAPALRLVGGFESRWLDRGEGRLGGALAAFAESGEAALGRVPAASLALALIVLLAVLAGLLSPGVGR